MKLLIAPDSFKECMDAFAVASILSDEISRLDPDTEVISCPLSDGGEGFAEIATRLLGGRLIPLQVTGPLGHPMISHYGRVGDWAIVDAASSCGLQQVPPERRNPLVTTTRGLGETLLAAYHAGCRRIWVGVGGTATCDGGAGMMSVPGLKEIRGNLSLEVLADVHVPFLGPEGAVQVYAPQKGATPEMLPILEKRMRQQAQQIAADTGCDVLCMPGAGAGGGLAGALMAYWGAAFRYGADALLDALHFKKLLHGTDAVITGEGRSDRQTLSGKVPQRVLLQTAGIPLVLLSGSVRDREELLAAGFFAVCPVTPATMPLDRALQADVAERNLRRAVRPVLEMLRGCVGAAVKDQPKWQGFGLGL